MACPVESSGGPSAVASEPRRFPGSWAALPGQSSSAPPPLDTQHLGGCVVVGRDSSFIPSIEAGDADDRVTGLSPGVVRDLKGNGLSTSRQVVGAFWSDLG